MTEEVFRRVLGVDVDDVDHFLDEPEDVRMWLERFSAPFLTYLAFSHRDPVITQRIGKAQLIDGLLTAHRVGADRGRLRLACLVYRYLRGRRQEALRQADLIVRAHADLPALDWAFDDNEQSLALAVAAAAIDPGRLRPYGLLDRAHRVRLVERPLIEDAPEIREDILRRLDEAEVDRRLARLRPLYGHARCIGVLHLPDHRCQVHVVRRGNRDSILTYDGFTHVTRGAWVILDFHHGGRALWLHPAEAPSLRIAEAVLAQSGDRVIRYEDFP